MTQACPEMEFPAACPRQLARTLAVQEQDRPPICDEEALARSLSPRRSLIEGAVAQVFGVHARDLRGVSRGRAGVALARQVAMYLTHVVFGLSMTHTGHIFHRDRKTVSHACGVVEDLRDDPVFDRVLELLEGVVPAIVLPRPLLQQLQN